MKEPTTPAIRAERRPRPRAVDLAHLKPIRTNRASEEVVFQLKEAVVAGRLVVGDRLPQERDLAKQFNVSRQSVREGLLMLEAVGMLTARRGAGPDSGWTVSGNGSTSLSVLLDLYASLQKIPLWDLLEIRESLEISSVRSAAARATPAEKAAIVAAVERMAAVTEAADFLRLDSDFHVMIARASRNSVAPLFMEALREAMSRVMLDAFGSLRNWPAERERLLHEHFEIAKMIEAGRGDDAVTALTSHIRGFYGRALSGSNTADA